MTKRLLSLSGTATALAGLWALMSTPVSTQTKSTAPPLVITAYGGKTPATPYKSPKTPWGEPDLVGVWSSDDDAGLPMSRPAAFGDRLYQTDEEYAARTKNIQQRAKQGDENAVGAFRFDYARRAFAQTSLIVDPPDGRQPAYTAESFVRAMPRGTYGNGPLDWTTDFSTYERCITRGILGSTLNVIYGNGEEIAQSPGYVTITYEMIHDTRIIPTDGRPHVGGKIRQ